MPRAKKQSPTDSLGYDSNLPADDGHLTDIRPLSATHEMFARHLFKNGNVVKAYLISHPRCTSSSRAKSDGRKLQAEPSVAAFLEGLRLQALGGEGSEADRSEWNREVRSVAFGRMRSSYVTAKDKIAALRTLGEAEKYIGGGVGASTGVRATFNFRIGNQVISPGALPIEGQTLSVELDTETGPAESEQCTSSTSSPPTSTSTSTSRPQVAGMCLTDDSGLRASDGRFRKQVIDKSGNTFPDDQGRVGSTASRSSNLGDSGGLFGSDNT